MIRGMMKDKILLMMMMTRMWCILKVGTKRFSLHQQFKRKSTSLTPSISCFTNNETLLGYEWNTDELHERMDFDDTIESEWNPDIVEDSMKSGLAKVQQGSNLKLLKKLARDKLRRGDV